MTTWIFLDWDFSTARYQSPPSSLPWQGELEGILQSVGYFRQDVLVGQHALN